MTIAAAYSAAGPAWAAGPSLVYDRLAELVVDRVPGGVAGRRVLDLGAGTGAASRAALAAGAAEVVASDIAVGMLAVDAGARPPACVGDAVALPFADGVFGAVVAAFSLNHVGDPMPALTEAARSLAVGGGLALSTYAEDDGHPAKEAVEAALRSRGWLPEPWYEALRLDAVPRLATVARTSAAMEAAGLTAARVEAVRQPFPDLGTRELVAWRLGMAQVATFVAGLGADELAAVTAEAEQRLGPHPPILVRSVVVGTWRKMAG